MVLSDARTRLADYLTPTVRLGVTGLARSGKTVFITALVRNLTGGGRLPFFAADAEGRIVRAYLEPQPDDAVPRFDYEAHLASLEAEPPAGRKARGASRSCASQSNTSRRAPEARARPVPNFISTSSIIRANG